MLVEVCKNPRSPGFNHYLFEAVAALIRHGAAADAGSLARFEETLFPAFDTVLQQDVQASRRGEGGRGLRRPLCATSPTPDAHATRRALAGDARTRLPSFPSSIALSNPPTHPSPPGVPPLRVPDPGAAHRAQRAATAPGEGASVSSAGAYQGGGVQTSPARLPQTGPSRFSTPPPPQGGGGLPPKPPQSL